MLFHRWETISHIISDTKLPWFTKTDEEIDGEYEFAEEESASKKYEMLSLKLLTKHFIYIHVD